LLVRAVIVGNYLRDDDTALFDSIAEVLGTVVLY
jgi:hypothetical protein